MLGVGGTKGPIRQRGQMGQIGRKAYGEADRLSATHEKRKRNKRKRTKKKIIKRKLLPAPTIRCIVFPHYRIGADRQAGG